MITERGIRRDLRGRYRSANTAIILYNNRARAREPCEKLIITSRFQANTNTAPLYLKQALIYVFHMVILYILWSELGADRVIYCPDRRGMGNLRALIACGKYGLEREFTQLF